MEATHFTGGQKGEKLEGNGGWRWVREIPHNNNPVNRRAILDEATCRVDTRVLHSKTMIHGNRVAGEQELRKLAGPLRGVMRDEGQGQKLPCLDSFQDVKAPPGDVDEARLDRGHLDVRLVPLEIEGLGDLRQPAQLDGRGLVARKRQLNIGVPRSEGREGRGGPDGGRRSTRNRQGRSRRSGRSFSMLKWFRAR